MTLVSFHTTDHIAVADRLGFFPPSMWVAVLQFSQSERMMTYGSCLFPRNSVSLRSEALTTVIFRAGITNRNNEC